jgi:alpha-glucuronidase
MGVAMISPQEAWADSPLNMINYYGLGRLAWNPDRSLDEIYNALYWVLSGW